MRSVIAAVLLAALAPLASAAELQVVPAVVSDYNFRGATRSALDPSAQLRVAVSGPSGLSLAADVATVDFGAGGPGVEVAPQLAWRGTGWQGATLESGLRYYAYDGAGDLNYAELWLGIARDGYGLRAYLARDFLGSREDAWYFQATLDRPLAREFRLVGHVGYGAGSYWDRFAGGGYLDAGLGLARRLGPVDLKLQYVTSGLDDGPSDVFATDGRLWLSVALALPWDAR